MWEWYSEADSQWHRYGSVEQALLDLAANRGLRTLFLVVEGQPAEVDFLRMTQTLVRHAHLGPVRLAPAGKQGSNPPLKACYFCQKVVQLLHAAACAPFPMRRGAPRGEPEVFPGKGEDEASVSSSQGDSLSLLETLRDFQ